MKVFEYVYLSQAGLCISLCQCLKICSLSIYPILIMKHHCQYKIGTNDNDPRPISIGQPFFVVV